MIMAKSNYDSTFKYNMLCDKHIIDFISQNEVLRTLEYMHLFIVETPYKADPFSQNR